MIPGVVARGMSIPSMVERPVFVGFVVMKREVTVFEPDDLETSRLDAVRIPAGIVDTDKPIRSELGLCLDVAESVTGSQPFFDNGEAIEIDWGTTFVLWSSRYSSTTAFVRHAAACRSVVPSGALAKARSRSVIRRRVVFHAERVSHTDSIERSVSTACAEIDTVSGDSASNFSL